MPAKPLIRLELGLLPVRLGDAHLPIRQDRRGHAMGVVVLVASRPELAAEAAPQALVLQALRPSIEATDALDAGKWVLTGANTYTGNTNVNRGVLQVDSSITSDTFVNHRGTLAGTGTVHGNVMNSDFGIVRPGGALGVPGVLTVVHNYTQAQYATLMIQIADTNTGQFSVLDVMGNANLNGYLAPVLLNGFVPTIGDSFIFLNYASLTGEFSRIRNQVFDNGMLQWSVTYQNTYAVLTVEPNTIPDQGSTLLLLTLGLLGLVMYRRQSLRGQPRALRAL